MDASIPLPIFPSQEIRDSLPAAKWTEYQHTVVAVLRHYLSLPPANFQALLETDSSLERFLTEYLTESFTDAVGPELREAVFLNVHRTLSETKASSPPLLHWTFLGDLSREYVGTKALKSLLENVWSRHTDTVQSTLQKTKGLMVQSLSQNKWPSDLEISCKTRLVPLIHSLPPSGVPFVTGSDFVDSLAQSYNGLPADSRVSLLVLLHLSLIAPLRLQKQNASLSFDQLYGLKANAESQPKAASSAHALLSDLVTETNILARILQLTKSSDTSRARKIVSSLEPFKRQNRSRPKRSRQEKGKEKALSGDYQAANGLQVHRASSISHIQDLFPDLGSAFVAKLLDEYNDDVEQVTAHLLDDSLPPHLQELDRHQNLAQTPADELEDTQILEPGTTPPDSIPERRNVFDNDEFDRLAVDTSRLRMGKQPSHSADNLLSDRSQAPNKAAILAALAAFDSDDDERDDTYDLEDVGGSVDATKSGLDIDTDGEMGNDKNEEVLFNTFKSNPLAFQRDASTRHGKERKELKDATGMTDEAIEGWAIMLNRDRRKLRRLETKYSSFSGQQRELAPTAWRQQKDSGAEDSESSAAENASRGSRARGRGHGGRGRGRGGNVSGNPSDHDTQLARQRKDTNKATRANHSRRDQRARKMARGGFQG